jgi:pyridoxine kinase
MLDAVLTGYFATPGAVAAAAEAIRAIKGANPRVVVLVDPVLGDAGRLYVSQATAEAIRDRLLPLATIATPNLFELAWLAGAAAAGDLEDVAQAARRLGPPSVVVTSAAETGSTLTTLLVAGADQHERAVPRRVGVPNGAGDHFAGLLLGQLLSGQGEKAALDAALADLERVLAASAGRDVLQLAALRS